MSAFGGKAVTEWCCDRRSPEVRHEALRQRVRVSPLLGERNHRERTGSADILEKRLRTDCPRIGRSTADVLQHTNEFEAAATWYRLNIPPAERDGASTSEQRKQRPKKPKTPSERRKQRSKKPKTLSQLRKKANQIEAAAKKLLRHLGVHHFREAADGPGDRDLLIFLASYGAASEEEVTQATAQIGRLAELSGAIAATKFLEVCAAEAAQEAINFGRLIPEGHLGDLPENEWGRGHDVSLWENHRPKGSHFDHSAWQTQKRESQRTSDSLLGSCWSTIRHRTLARILARPDPRQPNWRASSKIDLIAPFRLHRPGHPSPGGHESCLLKRPKVPRLGCSRRAASPGASACAAGCGRMA